jgi:4'-phosphopantetheinyl transferase
VDVQIWLASIDDLDVTPGRDSLSPAERERAARMPSPLLRHRFLGRRWMARTLLAQAAEKDPSELAIERSCDRCGGLHPASPLPTGSADVWWSASSSAHLAALAISPCRVGLDVEQARARRRWPAIARRFYTEAERRALSGSAARFLDFWTMKEAFLKARGLGLSGGLRSLDCTGLSALEEWSESAAHPGWRFRQLEPEPGFVAAVAVEGRPDSIEVRRWRPDGGETG